MLTMNDPLYRQEILDHYFASPHRGHLESPDLSAELDNPLCGDRIRLELGLEPVGRIGRIRFDGHGCAISQAAASMLAAHFEGHPVAEARRFSADDMVRLLGVSLTPARLKCGLLAWRALQRALPSHVESAAIGSDACSATV
jgi:nitrogen fixation protein NifU and related proteins